MSGVFCFWLDKIKKLKMLPWTLESGARDIFHIS